MQDDAGADGVIEALRALEPIFHREPPGTDRAGFAALVTEDYWEVGASGRRYDRDLVLDTVAARPPEPPGAWRVEDLAARPLGGGTWLATYVLHQGPRVTRRSTIWRHEGDRWVAVYHQGTLADGCGRLGS
jgi:hypothetical protein